MSEEEPLDTEQYSALVALEEEHKDEGTCDVVQDSNAPHGVNTEEEMSVTDADPVTD